MSYELGVMSLATVAFLRSCGILLRSKALKGYSLTSLRRLQLEKDAGCYSLVSKVNQILKPKP